jgi:hypothetical protein
MTKFSFYFNFLEILDRKYEHRVFQRLITRNSININRKQDFKQPVILFDALKLRQRNLRHLRSSE